MKPQKLLLVLLLIGTKSFAQLWDKIETKDGPHYISHYMDNINLDILGKYLFNGKEPVVELNQYGMGFYQLHDQLKRPMIWGLECDEKGALLFKKGFDNAKYILWYQYTTRTEEDTDEDMEWKPVEFTMHFNTLKMFIQGERSKDYKETASK
ncbi:hypothetical protein [Flavobacterium wongokense]|uniref:hypothetical protein n=1 Tax=Flavobacterium wongokense TaxID=2910674 RepID=UPI001F2181B8|nr:hypothetical protein [Flavobacterium sp. WG47]MCF6132910.1 hypothetical protein [Flavobacterium sp. WG47]